MAVHAAARPGDDRLQARVRSYELAAAMQLSATDALDISKEPQSIKDLYGLAPEGPGVDDTVINAKAETEFFGRKCLVARRLLERGVRFVQIWSGNDNGFPRRNWDSHEDVKRDHEPLALGMARGAAALIKDLKLRGHARGHPHSLDHRIRPHALFPRPARAGITTRSSLPTGCAAAESKAAPMATATNGVSVPQIGPMPPRSTTSTPPFCTNSGSTTNVSPFATTASTAA